MQLHLKFSGDGITVPMACQSTVQGLLYAALEGDPAYQAFLHQVGYRMENRSFRHFCFGRLRGLYKQVPEGLRFPNGFCLEVRSAQSRFIQRLLEGMQPGSVHRLGKNRVTVTEAILEDRHITAGEIAICMDSPVTVRSTQEGGATFFPNPFDPEFGRLLAGNAARKWISLYHSDPPGGLGFAPLEVTPRDKVVTQFKGFRITGWRGRYLLNAEPAVLDLLYQTGLGSRNAQGFGLFQLCHSSK